MAAVLPMLLPMSITIQAIADGITEVLGPPRASGRWRLTSGMTIWLAQEPTGTPKVGVSPAAGTQPEEWLLIQSAADLAQFLERLRSLALGSVLGS